MGLRTALYDWHVAHGARIVDFAGWDMPVQYSTIIDEHNAVLASFRHRVRAWVGRPALEVLIELEPRHMPTGYPWHAYYGARFGWRDERAALFRGVNGSNVQTGYTRPVSADFLEIRVGGERTFLFTGGLPFIQRHGTRMADVILVPEGEQGRRFELLIAADRDFPMATAVGWTSPAPVRSRLQIFQRPGSRVCACLSPTARWQRAATSLPSSPVAAGTPRAWEIGR